MKSRNKIKTQPIYLEYISPWRQPQSARHDIQYLISKNKVIQQLRLINKDSNPIIQPLQIPKQGVKNKQNQEERRKSTMRTHNKTMGDFKRYTQKRFTDCDITRTEVNRLRLKSEKKKEDWDIFQKLIFVKKSNPIHKTKVVTLGNDIDEKEDLKGLFKSVNLFGQQQQIANNKIITNHRFSFLSKKQTVCQQSYKANRVKQKQITFALLKQINSYQNNNFNEQGTRLLSRTLKNFMWGQLQV